MKLRIAILGLLVCAAIAGAVWFELGRPYAGFSGDVFVDIPRGTSTLAVAELLESKGVVRHRALLLLARALRPRGIVQAGEYRFDRAASVWDVFGRLARGDIFFYELQVPEGHNMFDIAASLGELGLMPGKAFLDAAADPNLIRDLAPRAPSLEGYLFPATYRLTRHTSPAQLCREMTDRFRRAWKEINAGAADPQATVTLASLVEKETGVGEERPLVASVFLNRLDKGMRLECDPTTVYAALLEDRYRGAIHRSDLDSRNRYNTYQNSGLPPGPIANPGMAALQAALSPAQSPYLYFVARPDGSGGHVFSQKLAQHEQAVIQYRRGLKKALQRSPNRATPRRATAAGNH